MYQLMSTTLFQHRTAIASNPHAYTEDLDRCALSVIPHLKLAGYKLITYARGPDESHELVSLLINAQAKRPFFHIEAPLPFCWNSPSKNGWKIDYIKYEWGHLLSRNQNGMAAHAIENLCLQSARCNSTYKALWMQ
jgi:hypothetical protein